VGDVTLALIRLASGQPPSPARGKAYRCAYRYYCAVMQVPVSEAFPLTGEGGTAGGGDG